MHHGFFPFFLSNLTALLGSSRSIVLGNAGPETWNFEIDAHVADGPDGNRDRVILRAGQGQAEALRELIYSWRVFSSTVTGTVSP